MIYRRLIVPVLVCLLGAGAARTQPGSPLIDDFTRGQTGVDGIAWTTTQHPDGRLFFGFDTVVEFDGAHWRTHPVDGAYAVRGLDVGADGRIWVGAMNQVGYLQPIAQGYIYRSLISHLPPALGPEVGDVWHAFAEGDGAIFITRDYVLRWTGQEFEWWHLPGARRLTGTRTEGRLYVGHGPTGLYQLTTEGLEKVVAASAIDGAAVEWIGRQAGHRVLATTRGLYRASANGTYEPFAPAVADWINANVLTSTLSLDPQRLVLGSLHGGVIIVDAAGRITRTLDPTNHLPTNAVYSLFRDREEALWITSPTKVLRLVHEGALSIIQPGRSSGWPARAMTALGDRLVFATEAGLHTLADRSLAHGETELNPLPLPHLHAHTLVPSTDGVLLGHRIGLSLLQPGGALLRLHRGTDIFAVLPLSGPREVLAAEGTRVLRIRESQAPEVLGQLPDLPTSLALGAGETILAGTWSRGIGIVGPQEEAYRFLEEALQNEPAASYLARAGETLVAVRGAKVAWLREGEISGSAPLVPGFRPTAVVVEGDSLWVAGERRASSTARRPLMYQIRTDDGGVRVQAWADEALGRAGVPTVLHAQSEGGNTILWLGGDTGILRIDTSRLAHRSPPLAPAFRLSASSGSESDPFVLPYAGNRLEIDLVWPEPGRRSGLLVQTMLAGDDGGEWSEPQELTTIRLGNLQNGRYQLQARFVTADGQTSPSGSLNFRVLPPWWRAPPTLVLGFALGVVVLYGVLKLRLRSLRRRAERLERLVQQRTAQLTHANQAKTEFVAKMSHELRNPLNGIVASAHALETAGINPEQRELVGTLRHCAQLLDALIGDVLDFSEIEAGRITLQAADYDPIEAVNTALAIIRPIAVQKGLLVESEAAGGVPRQVCGDPSRVQQVLLNLLGNAIKFSDHGRILLRLAPAADGLCFSVADEGPGIPSEHRGQLFEKFARAPHARLQNIPGTGLGLAVCRQLVEQMGGEIWLEPSATKGAVFTFRLPLNLPQRNAARAGARPSLPLPKQALVVEDLDYNARAMVAMLSRLGCFVQTAATGAAALTLLREQKFDAVFLDCDLPDIKGPALARAILAAAPSQSVMPRLIATTAYADEATREECLRAGMHAFIAKPVSPEKLRTVFTDVSPLHVAAPPMVMPEAEVEAEVDEGALDTRLLATIAPDADGLRLQVGRLQEMIRTDLHLIRTSFEHADFAAMRAAAHRMVSHARFIGARQLAAIAAEIQDLAEAHPDEAAELIPAAEQESMRVLEELSRAPLADATAS